MTRVAVLLSLAAASCAQVVDHGEVCGDSGEDCESLDLDPDPPAPPDAGSELDSPPVEPTGLVATGLCVDSACTQYAPDVHEFMPRWQLWSDGAVKRRWIYLPPGTQIDTTDQDAWKFPVGTRLWKDFVRDGVRVETRYAEKTGPGDGDWLFVPYQWSADQSDAVPITAGATNVNGTGHDIPATTVCLQCHANVRSRVLGFQTFQLDYDAQAGNLDLADATAAGWLTQAVPHRTVPGTAQEVAALGYFHANCGHCHNSKSNLVNKPSLRLEVGFIASVTDTKAYRTTVNVTGTTPFGGATIVARPGDPDHSIIITRMMSTNPNKRMPWLGGEIADPTGLATLRAWISAL
jgi:cytochrome c553